MNINFKLSEGVYPSDYYVIDFDGKVEEYLESSNIPGYLWNSCVIDTDGYHKEVKNIILDFIQDKLQEYNFKSIKIDKEFSKILGTYYDSINIDASIDESNINDYIEYLYGDLYGYLEDSMWELGIDENDLKDPTILVATIINTISYKDGFMGYLEDKLNMIDVSKYIKQ